MLSTSIKVLVDLPQALR